VLGFLIGEALGNLRRAGRIVVSAVVLTALSLGAVGAFWIVSVNLGQAVARWREQIRIIAYLKREPPPADVTTLVEHVEGLPGVARVRYISKADALRALKTELGSQAAVADALPENPLPASLEVLPDGRQAAPEIVAGLVRQLEGLSEVEDVQGGTEWVERVAHWQRLLQLLGLATGALLATAAILTVTTATTLVVHDRRDELDIMRLVGAPEAVIRLPLLLQGMAQGLLGAAGAVIGLIAAFEFVRPRIEPLVHLTLGLPAVSFLPTTGIGTLLLAGALLGGLGGLVARRRA
jgi:cell division transport system permease protein